MSLSDSPDDLMETLSEQSLEKLSEELSDDSSIDSPEESSDELMMIAWGACLTGFLEKNPSKTRLLLISAA